MFDTSSEQPSASSVIVVSNSSSYHTSGSDVINAAFTEAFGSVCDASYYFKNLIDFHQSHFHHLHKHHVFNLNLNVKTTSTDTSSDDAANPPLTNTTNLSQTAKKKRKHDTLGTLKPDKIEDNLINLKLDTSNLDENLNVKTSCGRAKRSKPCTFIVKKLIFKKYRRLRWTQRRPRATAKQRPCRFRRVRRAAGHAEAVAAQAEPAQPDSYLAYQSTAGYYYSSDADVTRTQFYEEQNSLYQPGPARALNHDLLKLSYDKFKQFRLNEKLLQQTVLIRNAIKLLQYELQYQHEQEIQQQYLYQQQQQHQHHQLQQHHLAAEYNQSSYQHPLMQMNASVYESVDEVMSRSVESTSHVQTTSYFVNDVNRTSAADENEEEEDEDEEESKQTDNNHNTQTVNESAETSYF